MSCNRTKTRLSLVLITTLTVLLAAATSAEAIPVKQIPTARFGADVNATSGGDVCTVESHDSCQTAQESATPGGFAGADGVAVAPDGNFYVVEANNRRVQELKPNGEFVLMFGDDVNGKTGGNVCTAAEAGSCKAGVAGSGAGEFDYPTSISVDQKTGDVYVADTSSDARVQEFTPSGEFVLMFGKDVNATTGGNICTAAEQASCKAGVPGVTGGSEEGALNLPEEAGSLLAVGGPEDLVYVGGEHRVQEFDAETGAWKGEIPLSSISSERLTDVQALAVDEAGEVYLTYYGANYSSTLVYGFNAKREQIVAFPVRSPVTSGEILITALAIEASGDALAVGESEDHASGVARFGSLYDPLTGHRITEFTSTSFDHGMAFSGNEELYIAAGLFFDSEVLAYKAVPVAELLTSPVACVAGGNVETSATFACTLSGQVNPDGVSATKVWFQWGNTAGLSQETSKEPFGEGTLPLPVSATVSALRPDETYDYRLAGEDKHVISPELLTSETGTFITPTVPPRIPGTPAASFIGASSTVLSGELNPEHASSAYFFEYGQCYENKVARCAESPYGTLTPTLDSGAYGLIETTGEAGGLQPASTYHYRLVADNEHVVNSKTEGGTTNGAEAKFTTLPAPVVQAITGGVSGLTSSGASVSGTVYPDGQPATYEFELGVANGPQTAYGVVFSGAVPASAAGVAESLQLTGLQPGTTYAYRIKVSSPGYGVAVGEAQTFTTVGLPEVLVSPTSLALLAVPAIAFPTETKVTTAKAPVKVEKKAKKKKKKQGKKKAKAKKTSRSRKAKR